MQLSQLLHGADSGTGKVAGPGAAGRGRALPLDQQVRVAAQLADAMEYVHAQRVMHGDLKPQARCQTRTRPAACAPCTRRLSGSEGGGGIGIGVHRRSGGRPCSGAWSPGVFVRRTSCTARGSGTW